MDSIVTSDLVKTYRIGVGRARVREMLARPLDQMAARLFPRWWSRNTFNALDELTLHVPAGQSLGLVGHNGAGKTTLLRVISGVTEPTKGSVEVKGRVAALIDVLVGFHPDLTGRENALLLGGIHGIRPRSMASRLDRIFEFAEIDDMADTPLKRYSAGMSSRLGFATITAVEPEVLLIDEVLAVGDATFQRKCMRWLEDYRSGGGTLVFVSHNLGLVRNMTERVLWLDHGKVAEDGPTAQVLTNYARAMERRDVGPAGQRRKATERAMVRSGMYRWGAGGARVDEVHVDDSRAGQSGIGIAIRFDAPDLEEAIFCVGFVDGSGNEIGAAASPSLSLNGGQGSVQCEIRPFPFRAGIYFPVVGILSTDGVVRDRWRLERAIVVDEINGSSLGDTFGPVDIAAAWSSGSAPV